MSAAAAGERAVEPEWLDTLPPAEAGAQHSRRDLQRLNFWMGHVTIMRRFLSNISINGSPIRLVELGSGDGTFLLRLARALDPRWRGTQAVLVDRQPSVSEKTRAGFARLGWQIEIQLADVVDYLSGQGSADVISANLFLHHFQPEPLQRLLTLAAAQCRAFVACEPERNAAALAASRLLWLARCHPVTRHDAVVSVRAGFAGGELSALWPGCGWTTQEKRVRLVTHTFAALRR